MTYLTYRVLERLTSRKVHAGEIVTVDVDAIMAHDGSGPVVGRALDRHGIHDLTGAARTVFIFDHFFPPTSAAEANLHKEARAFAARHGIRVVQGQGIAHQVLPEMGLVRPGTVVVGADSHTCTGGAFGALAIGLGATDVAAVLATGRLWLEVPEVIRVRLTGRLAGPASAQDLALHILTAIGTDGALGMALEFVGPAITRLRVADRMKIANHATEMGAVSGMFPVDRVSRKWLAEHGADLKYVGLVSDDGDGEDPVADLAVELADVVPTVALPDRPDLTRPVAALDAAIAVDQVFIGSCAGGRLEDFHDAAAALAGRTIASGTRMYIGPASATVLHEATADGTIAALQKAGATVLPPGCGACLGRVGALGDDEVCVSAQNRNFSGRSGSSSAKIYLASPTVAAAVAVAGTLPATGTGR